MAQGCLQFLAAHYTCLRIGTGCCHAGRMAQGIYNRLRHKNLATDIAMLAFCKTGFRTGCCNCFVDHFVVSERCNFILFYQCFVTYGAFHSRGKTGISAGCRHCRDRLRGVSLSINYKSRFIGCGCSCFIQEENATIITATLVMFSVSGFEAGGFLSLNLFGLMTEGSYVLGVGMRLIILTDKDLDAPSCTGRISGNFTFNIVMTEFRNDHNSGFHCTVFILEYTVTSAAGVVCIVAVRCAGCVLSLGQGRAVTKGSEFAISGVVALIAIHVCIPTDFRTGSCPGSYCCDIMTGGRDGRLLNGGFICTGFILKHLVTLIARVVFNVTGGFTGGCLSVGLGHVVAKGSEGLSLNGGFICTGFILKHLATCCACIVFIVSGRCTGCFLGIGLVHAVFEYRNYFLFYQNFAADGTFLSRGKTGFGTGCRHCRDSLLGMTLGRNILSRSLLCCPSDNKGCGVCLQALFCAGSRCCHNTFYFCCYCFNMAAVIGAHTLSGAVNIAIRPFIGCLSISMAQCGNIFYILSLCNCPFDIKGCSVCCPALFDTGCGSLNCTGYSCCYCFNMAAVSGAHTLSSTNPDIIRGIILPNIICFCKAMTKCNTDRNGLVGAYRITTVTLYIVSRRFCTGSRRFQFLGSFISITMPQLSAFFCKHRLGAYRITTVTLCKVYRIFCTSSLFKHLIGKQCITMIQSRYFVRHIAVIAFTGVCSIATIDTSRCSYNTGVLVLMRFRCNYDILIRGDIINVDIDHLTAKLGIVYLCLACMSNVYAIAENGYLHDKGRILKLKACIEVITRYNGTCRTFHSGYTIQVVDNVYMIFCKESAMIANRRFKRVCKNLHTLDIGMQPVFHQVFKVLFICLDTGVFNINHCQAKVRCHLSDILIKLSRLMNTCSEGEQSHYIDLRVGISLLHLMEGDSIGLHGVCRRCVSKPVSIIFDQCSKVYSFKASQH